MHGALALAVARRCLDSALAEADRLQSPSSVAVLDAGRELVAFARQEGARLVTVELAIAKAFTARSLNTSTGDLADSTQPGGPFYGLEVALSRPLVTFAGGRPLRSGEEIVGAVGVSGGTLEQDEAISLAAAAAMEAR
jgi:uncharacterized protein GlcG (DUF336 family)